MMQKLKVFYTLLLSTKKRIGYAVFGDKNYDKFVIISTSRTGSTLLMALLNKHDNILCEGELFKQLEGHSCSHIWNALFSKKPKKIKHVGFKLFYFHPFCDDKQVWDFIKNDTNVKIIHLVRQNLLRILISQKIGLKTKLWTDNMLKPNNIGLDDKKTHLEYDECVEFFETTTNYENKTRHMFKDHNFIEVKYEHLSSNRVATLKDVFEFLNVPIQNVDVNNKKQNNEQLDELINNFDELKERFKNSVWAHYFIEDNA